MGFLSDIGGIAGGLIGGAAGSVIPGVGTAAGASIGFGLGSSLGGASAAKGQSAAASAAQQDAARKAIELQKQQFEASQRAFAPYTTAGQTAINAQLALLGLGPPSALTYNAPTQPALPAPAPAQTQTPGPITTKPVTSLTQPGSVSGQTYQGNILTPIQKARLQVVIDNNSSSQSARISAKKRLRESELAEAAKAEFERRSTASQPAPRPSPSASPASGQPGNFATATPTDLTYSQNQQQGLGAYIPAILNQAGGGNGSGIRELGQNISQGVNPKLAPVIQNVAQTPGEQQDLYSTLIESPQFQSLYNQYEEGLLANASAAGALRGGSTREALAKFRPQLLSDLINQRFSQLGTISGLGQASAAGLSGAGQNYASNVGNLYGNIGSAQAGQALTPSPLQSLGGAIAPYALGYGINKVFGQESQPTQTYSGQFGYEYPVTGGEYAPEAVW